MSYGQKSLINAKIHESLLGDLQDASLEYGSTIETGDQWDNSAALERMWDILQELRLHREREKNVMRDSFF